MRRFYLREGNRGLPQNTDYLEWYLRNVLLSPYRYDKNDWKVTLLMVIALVLVAFLFFYLSSLFFAHANPENIVPTVVPTRVG
jgi:hypothetical protein